MTPSPVGMILMFGLLAVLGCIAARRPAGRRWALATSVLVAIPMGSLAPSSASASAGLGIRCRAVTMPVALQPGQARSYRVWGQLCVPAGKVPRAAQLLLHGATYTHTYWDWPDDGSGRYSYVRHLAPAGYATLAIDRIGHGHSSKPLSVKLDATVNAYVAHRVISALRDGTIGRFPAVMTIGHSYGSLTAMEEAGTWGDVSATILTGILHKVSPTSTGR